MSQGMKAWEPEPRQFVVRFKCGCCVRFPERLGNREHVKCDMVNGCYFNEEAVKFALRNKDDGKLVESSDHRVQHVTWGWERNFTAKDVVDAMVYADIEPTEMRCDVWPEILADAAAGIPRQVVSSGTIDTEAILNAGKTRPAPGCKLNLEEAKCTHCCRVCGRNTIKGVDGEELESTCLIPPDTLVLNYGEEFAHKSCLAELKDIAENPCHADGSYKVLSWLGKESQEMRMPSAWSDISNMGSPGKMLVGNEHLKDMNVARFAVEETMSDLTVRYEAQTIDGLMELRERWHDRKVT